MSLLEEGIWPCTVLNGGYGEDDRNMLVARINVRIDDGPSKGRNCTYEDKIDARSALYISRSCKAVGWAGKSIDTLANDIAAWVKATGGKSTVEIRHIEIKKGKKYDDWAAGGRKGPPPIWDKVNSLGRGPRPLKEASQATRADADEALRAAMAADGGVPPDDDAPRGNDDVPFVTCSSIATGEIARVLR